MNVYELRDALHGYGNYCEIGIVIKGKFVPLKSMQELSIDWNTNKLVNDDQVSSDRTIEPDRVLGLLFD